MAAISKRHLINIIQSNLWFSSDNSMYAIGGCSTERSVERFDGREGKWFSLSSTLIHDRWEHGLAVLDNNYIYCTGGCKL